MINLSRWSARRVEVGLGNKIATARRAGGQIFCFPDLGIALSAYLIHILRLHLSTDTYGPISPILER